MKTLEEIEEASIAYANDREGVEGMSRIDEVAMAWRDAYRTAMGDIVVEIKEKRIGAYK